MTQESEQKLGGYTLGERIGVGAMGRVYRATAPDGGSVAVKVLHGSLTCVEEYVRRFRREAKLAEKLAHPNVVRVLDSGEDGGTHYIVMEYVAGETLTARLERAGIRAARVKSAPPGRAKAKPVGAGSGAVPEPEVRNLPIPEVIGVMRQVAGVLQAAAGIGLLHRDIKPQNILLDAKGSAKVLDFGLAKDTHALASMLSHTGQMIGTPPYMSPEQHEGRADVDTRSDLYSLGATAYQMLTGRPPFPGPTASAYARQHSEAIPVPAHKLNPAVPLNLSQVVDRLLAKRPQDRHQTPAELIEDLNRVERGEVPLKLHRPRRSRQYSPATVALNAAAAVLVTVGAVGGWLWWTAQNADGVVAEQVTRARQQAERGDLAGAAAALDRVIERHAAGPPERTAPARALRADVQKLLAGAVTRATAEGDAAMDARDYTKAAARYEAALAYGDSAPLRARAQAAKKAVEAEQERLAREAADRKAAEDGRRMADLAEQQRRMDLRKALNEAEKLAGDETRLEAALTAAERALDLARAADEEAQAKKVLETVKAALAVRREYAAVVEFTVDPSVRDKNITGTAIAVKLEQAVSSRFRLVSRDQIDKALVELKFSRSDLADSAKALQIGRFVRARYLVAGRVLELGGTITVAATLFDVETGVIRQAAEVEAREAGELNAGCTDLARLLTMSNEEKAAYLTTLRDRIKARNSAPTLRIVAEAGGAEVPATIECGGKTWTAPQTLSLSNGLAYAFRIAYAPSGASRRWEPAELKLTADWTGPRTNRVALKAGISMIEPPPAPILPPKARRDVVEPPPAPPVMPARTGVDMIEPPPAPILPPKARREVVEPPPAPVMPPALSRTAKYPVSEGETVESIAKAFLVAPKAVRELNNMTDSASLKAGTTILVPWGEEQRARAAAQFHHPDMRTPWTNSLGMPFVPVAGTEVLFCVWETRNKDYRAFKPDHDSGAYEGQSLNGNDHPVVEVSWYDAKDFCSWLTTRERQQGVIGHDQTYRLPMDWEWSRAVGLDEIQHGTPRDKDGQSPEVFPWGLGAGTWPPPRNAGNYSPAAKCDTYGCTSPVGSFPANANQLCDLGGNVWEWCEDFYHNDRIVAVSRGASWEYNTPDCLCSSYRRGGRFRDRDDEHGFRIVLGSHAEATFGKHQSIIIRSPRDSRFDAVPPVVMPPDAKVQEDPVSLARAGLDAVYSGQVVKIFDIMWTGGGLGATTEEINEEMRKAPSLPGELSMRIAVNGDMAEASFDNCAIVFDMVRTNGMWWLTR